MTDDYGRQVRKQLTEAQAELAVLQERAERNASRAERFRDGWSRALGREREERRGRVQAEARIAAVRALARGWIADGPEGEARILAERVLAALDGPADPEAMPALAALLELAEGVRADLPVGQYPDGPS